MSLFHEAAEAAANQKAQAGKYIALKEGESCEVAFGWPIHGPRLTIFKGGRPVDFDPAFHGGEKPKAKYLTNVFVRGAGNAKILELSPTHWEGLFRLDREVDLKHRWVKIFRSGVAFDTKFTWIPGEKMTPSEVAAMKGAEPYDDPDEVPKLGAPPPDDDPFPDSRPEDLY